MQKLVKEDKLADSRGAFCTPTCSSANRKKERAQLKRVCQLDLVISPLLQPPHTPRCRCHHLCSYYTDSVLSPLGWWASLFTCSRKTPVVLLRQPSVLEVSGLTGRWPLSFWSRGLTSPLPYRKGLTVSLSFSHRNYRQRDMRH